MYLKEFNASVKYHLDSDCRNNQTDNPDKG